MKHRTFGYFDLIETLPKQGCAVCTLLLRDVTLLLDKMQYEYVVDRETQRKFRASRGLCDEHGWRLAQIGNALSVAVLYETALDELLKIIDQQSPVQNITSGFARRLFTQNAGSTLADALEPTSPCAACDTEDAAESRYIDAFTEHLTDEPMLAAYRSSEGLCMEHFKLALRAINDREKTTLLITTQRAIWERLQVELNEFMRKSDYQHANEVMGAEATSWARAVARIGGEHGVFGLRRRKLGG